MCREPRYVEMDRCVACGLCALGCPVRGDGDSGERGIHTISSQAVPIQYRIDPASCLRLAGKADCALCVEACPADAIRFDRQPELLELRAGALILNPGCHPFDPATLWDGHSCPDIVTSVEFERILAESPGSLRRPSDREEVRSLAFVQCVGSRDVHRVGHAWCSSVCCMASIKEAVAAKERQDDLQVTVFFVDMRAHGKEFDALYDQAVVRHNIRFVRCRLQDVIPLPAGGLRLHYADEQGRQAEETADLAVLAVGLQPAGRTLAKQAGIRLTPHEFGAVSDFSPVSSSRAGIFAGGTFTSPKDIGQCAAEGSAAAAAAAALLADRRKSPVQRRWPRSADHHATVRVGVVLCRCGTNIDATVDLDRLEQWARARPDVVAVIRTDFACSGEGRDRIERLIRHRGVTRLVVAACSPLQYEHLFREILADTGLNPFLLSMANLRNQCAWMHDDREAATAKGLDMLRMAVQRVKAQYPLEAVVRPVARQALVVGGGLAGMSAALNLADQGFPVTLVEKGEELGGNALHLHVTWSGEKVPLQLRVLRDRVMASDLITLYLNSEVTAASGAVGSFRSTVRLANGRKKTVEHGVTILATGGSRLMPEEYGYRKYREVLTALEFDKLREINDIHVLNSRSFVFVQCVGSREEGRNYCSKVCCTHAVQTAIQLKKEQPARQVYVLYRDMRTYGQREPLYTRARELGVVFINYELHGKPRVKRQGGHLEVEVWDHVLHRPLLIRADMVILAAAIVPSAGTARMAELYGVQLDDHGFVREAHAKLRPVDTSVDGVFVAGLAQFPKPVEESIAQALAAAGRAATILAGREMVCDPLQARIVPELCDACAVCVDVCPYRAISLTADDGRPAWQRVRIDQALCRGCGICQGICPKRGVEVEGFTWKQLLGELEAALEAG